MSIDVGDLGVVFTCCMFPGFTLKAMQGVYKHYPDLPDAVIAVDGCKRHVFERYRAEWDKELKELLSYGRTANVVVSGKRIGAGRMLDKALKHMPDDPHYVLTIEHGIRMHKRGAVEIMLEHVPGPVAVGRARANNRGSGVYGRFVEPMFALFDRRFILEHGLSFVLCNIVVEGRTILGVTTSQLLQYNAMSMGNDPCFVRYNYRHYYSHERTPKTRGQCASPHEVITVDPSKLPAPRERRRR